MSSFSDKIISDSRATNVFNLYACIACCLFVQLSLSLLVCALVSSLCLLCSPPLSLYHTAALLSEGSSCVVSQVEGQVPELWRTDSSQQPHWASK